MKFKSHPKIVYKKRENVKLLDQEGEGGGGVKDGTKALFNY